MNDSTRQPENANGWAAEITRSAGTIESCVKRFYGLVWLLPEVCCISFPGKACSSFTGSTGTGGRTRKRLFTGWYSLESVCVCSEAGESNRSPGSRSREADTGARVGQVPGGTSDLEGACYFWYLLYVVHFYTDWKNKVRWEQLQTMFVSMKGIGIFIRT